MTTESYINMELSIHYMSILRSTRHIAVTAVSYRPTDLPGNQLDNSNEHNKRSIETRTQVYIAHVGLSITTAIMYLISKLTYEV